MFRYRILTAILLLWAICAAGQEKIHVQTDRGTYLPGERIWLRAHLVDGSDGRPSRISRYVYVELLAPGGELMRRIMLRPDSLGVFAGHIDLQETLPEGDYTLRSYTRFMQNFGEDSFFRRPLRVLNPYSSGQGDPASGKRLDYEVSLLPEGGYLVPGRACRVGVKALGEDGLGLNVNGKVLDSKGREVASIDNLHRGMGSFILKPQDGEKYTAVCNTPYGREKRFPVPAANPAACALQLLSVRGGVTISLLRGPSAPTEELVLAIHQCGKPIGSMEWEPDRNFASFNLESFPSGIIVFSLGDKSGRVLSERLYFNFGKDCVTALEGDTGRTVFAGREKVRATFRLPGNALASADGTCIAVSVTDARAFAPDSSYSLASTLLLSSELKGYVEAPAEYFTPSGRQHIDALMLTQAWRRYSLPSDVIAPERAQTLSGQATGFVFNKMEGGRVSLYATLGEKVTVDQASLGKDGRFRFDTEFPEGTEITVQTQTRKGQKGNILEMDEVEYPATDKAALPQHREVAPPDDNTLQAFDEYIRINGLQETLLNAATVSASLQKKPSESIWYSEMNSTRPLTSEEIEKMNFTNILSVFLNTPGATVRHNANGNYVSTTRSELPALPVIDDVVLPEYDVMTMSPQDIESLFIIKDYTSQFGYYPGYSGALVIKTTNGFVAGKPKSFNITKVRPLGYQQRGEFWSPEYITQKQKDSPEQDLRNTIYWNPSVRFDASGECSFEFWTADKETEYQIVGEGVSRDGRILELHHGITIKTE